MTKDKPPLIKPTTLMWAGWLSFLLTFAAGVMQSIEPFGRGTGTPLVLALSVLTMACFLTALFNQREGRK